MSRLKVQEPLFGQRGAAAHIQTAARAHTQMRSSPDGGLYPDQGGAAAATHIQTTDRTQTNMRSGLNLEIQDSKFEKQRFRKNRLLVIRGSIFNVF